jgi:uncharacterized protein YlxW (UPF0749 family)
MFLQFKSVQVIEESGVGQKRETELRTEYSTLKDKSSEMKQQLEEIQNTTKEYTDQSSDVQATMDLLKSDVDKARCDLGYTDVKGPGIILTIADGKNAANDKEQVITYNDLIMAINELKYAGAEAISLNDERVVNNSFVANISEYMVMNDNRISGPYTIKVIGDSKNLESVINIKGGIKDYLESYNKQISYTVENEVYINKYNGNVEINFGE